MKYKVKLRNGKFKTVTGYPAVDSETSSLCFFKNDGETNASKAFTVFAGGYWQYYYAVEE